MSFTFLKIKVIKRICSYSLAQKQGSPFHVFPYFLACKMYYQRKGTPYNPLLSYDAVEQKGKANEVCLLLLSKLQDTGKVVSFPQHCCGNFIPAAALTVITSRSSMKYSSECMCHPSKGNQVAQWDTMCQGASFYLHRSDSKGNQSKHVKFKISHSLFLAFPRGLWHLTILIHHMLHLIPELLHSSFSHHSKGTLADKGCTRNTV